MFKIKLIYNDDKELNINIPPEEYMSFFQAINSGQVFWGKGTNTGFWTSLANVRYMTLERPMEAPSEPKPIDPSAGSCAASTDEPCGIEQANDAAGSAVSDIA